MKFSNVKTVKRLKSAGFLDMILVLKSLNRNIESKKDGEK